MIPQPAGLKRTALVAAAVAIGMVGMSYAAVPLYDLFCKVTGYGGATQVAAKAPDTMLARTMEVRFDANVAPGLALQFKPQNKSQRAQVGQMSLAFYTVKNLSNQPVTAVATYNVTPHRSGIYFQKLECFCFEDRVFAPGQEMTLPVAFFVSPLIEQERTLRTLDAITLSYTFFAKPTAQGPADASQPGPLGVGGDAG
jgi:cytochrome c oxidase assembly protein subunit 11